MSSSLPLPPFSEPAASRTGPRSVGGISAPPPPDFTDEDLRNAFVPILESAVLQSVFPKSAGSPADLEPLLRATIRRAIAEYLPASRPFRAPGAFDRLRWHLRAAFTSRSYEDVLFEKTRRFLIEETYLLDVASLALVSFASSDPARHSSPKRVGGTVNRLATRVRRDDGAIRECFELPDRRSAIALAGSFVVLVAVIRGRPDQMTLADLEFSLRRIEDRFREHFLQPGSQLLESLQPFLEECLLIQSPGIRS
jgi:hypothetical protein